MVNCFWMPPLNKFGMVRWWFFVNLNTNCMYAPNKYNSVECKCSNMHTLARARTDLEKWNFKWFHNEPNTFDVMLFIVCIQYKCIHCNCSTVWVQLFKCIQHLSVMVCVRACVRAYIGTNAMCHRCHHSIFSRRVCVCNCTESCWKYPNFLPTVALAPSLLQWHIKLHLYTTRFDSYCCCCCCWHCCYANLKSIQWLYWNIGMMDDSGWMWNDLNPNEFCYSSSCGIFNK